MGSTQITSVMTFPRWTKERPAQPPCHDPPYSTGSVNKVNNIPVLKARATMSSRIFWSQSRPRRAFGVLSKKQGWEIDAGSIPHISPPTEEIKCIALSGRSTPHTGKPPGGEMTKEERQPVHPKQPPQRFWYTYSSSTALPGPILVLWILKVGVRTPTHQINGASLNKDPSTSLIRVLPSRPTKRPRSPFQWNWPRPRSCGCLSIQQCSGHPRWTPQW